MGTVLILAFFLFVAAVTYECYKILGLEKVRQDLFRIRDRIYDRVIDRQLSLDDPNVRSMVDCIHGLAYIIEHWTIFDLVRAIIQVGPKDDPIGWVEEPRLQDEGKLLLESTARAVRRMSPCARLVVRLLGMLLRGSVSVWRRWAAILLATRLEEEGMKHSPIIG